MGQIIEILNRWFKIRSGEGGRVFCFFLIQLLIGLVFVFVNSSIQSVFLTEFGAKNLPFVMIFQALFQIFGMVPYTARADSVKSNYFFHIIFAGTIGTLLFVYAAAGLSEAIPTYIRLGTYALAYAAIMMMINIQDVHFEKFAAAYFDTLQFKRLIPIVSTGARFGTIFGGFGLPFIVGIIGTRNLSFACIVLTILNMLVVMFVSHYFPSTEGLAVTPRKRRVRERERISSFENFRQGFRFVIHSSLLRMTAGATFAMMLALEIMRYQYNEVFATTFPNADTLTSFLGQFAAFAELITILIPLFIVPRLLTIFGVGTVKLIYPAITLSCFIAIIIAPFFPSHVFPAELLIFLSWLGVPSEMTAIFPVLPALFLAASWGRFVKVNLRKVIETTVSSMIYNAVPQSLRGRSRAFIEMISRVGGISAGLIILGFAFFSQGAENIALANTVSWQGITYLGLIISVLYFVFSWGQKREYVNSLITLLQGRNVDLSSVHTEEVAKISGAELKRLVQTINEDDEEMSLFAIEVLGQVGGRKTVDTLLHVMPKKSYRVEEKILDILGNSGFSDLAPHVSHYLKSESPQVRAAAVTAIGKLGNSVETYLQPLLHDGASIVRAKVIAILLQSKDPSVQEDAYQILQKMYSSENIKERTAAVHAIGETNDKSYVPLLQHVLKDPEPDVRFEAVTALKKLANVGDTNFTEDFLKMIKDPSRDVRRVAAEAFIYLQDPQAVPMLIEALYDTPKIRNNAIDALAALGQTSIEPLVDVLKDVNVPVRVKEYVIMALNKIGSEKIRGFLLLFAQTALKQAYQNVMYIATLERVTKSRSVELLIKALKDRNEEIKTLAMRILESMDNSQVLRLVERVLKRKDVDNRTRANALETLGNVGEQELIRLMLPLYDQMTSQELARQIANRWDVKQLDISEIFSHMLIGSDNWLKACTIFAIGDLGKTDFIPSVRASLRDQDPFVREVAEEAINKLNQNLGGSMLANA